MTKEKIPLVIAIVIVMAALIVLAIALATCKKESKPEAGGPAVEEEVAIAEEIYGISGEIKEIRDEVLLMEANILLADPGKKPIKEMVRIKVTDQTKILKLKFPEEIPEGSIELIFPEETEISFNDLKVGDKIDIETADNVSENIKNKTEVIASIINVVE